MKILRALAVLALFIGTAAKAEPVKFKFAFLGSDQSGVFVSVIKPFIDAVNAEGKGVIEIEAFIGGALGRVPDQQVTLVLNGTADLAFVVPGLTPERFAGSEVIELPGLFRDAREATLTFTRLATSGALPGYEDFFVVGAMATEPDTIHIKPAAANLAGLKDRRIRVNNTGGAAAVERLGMTPVIMPANATPEAIGSGKIDGAAMPVGGLADFGIARITSTHYLLPIGAAPLTVLMSRAKFEALPAAAQDIIRKYSGEWIAKKFIELRDRQYAQTMDQIKANPARKIIQPSKAEVDLAQAAFGKIVAEWSAKSPGNMALLKKTEADLSTIRSNP